MRLSFQNSAWDFQCWKVYMFQSLTVSTNTGAIWKNCGLNCGRFSGCWYTFRFHFCVSHGPTVFNGIWAAWEWPSPSYISLRWPPHQSKRCHSFKATCPLLHLLLHTLAAMHLAGGALLQSNPLLTFTARVSQSKVSHIRSILGFMVAVGIYPLVMTNIAIENGHSW